MRILVLDTRNGDDQSDLFVADPVDHRVERIPLKYVPEIGYDPATNQLLIAETELDTAGIGHGPRCWLRLYDATNLRLVQEIETPDRPMYAGFPNRSTRLVASRSGRFVYFQILQRHPERTDIYRVRAGRFDRYTNRIETGHAPIDSCTVDFGMVGDSENELYFHLCCDLPNTVAFTRFASPDVDAITLADTRSRAFSPEETCGSWRDKSAQALYCNTRGGLIYRIEMRTRAAELFCRLPINRPRAVPLQHIYGSGKCLFVGIARDDAERSLSLASEIWIISIEDGRVLRVFPLEEPILNFVVDDNARTLYGVSPYGRSLQFVDVDSGKLAMCVTGIGVTPCEVQLIP